MDVILLSYSDSSSFSFGEGSTPIHMRSIYCKGIESSLVECEYTTTPSRDCTGDYGLTRGIIGVQCGSRKNIVEVHVYMCYC